MYSKPSWLRSRNLTDAIEKKAKTTAEAATAEQERVDEAERQRAVWEQQLEQARQVPVVKEQIKVMYKEAVDAMKKTARPGNSSNPFWELVSKTK